MWEFGGALVELFFHRYDDLKTRAAVTDRHHTTVFNPKRMATKAINKDVPLSSALPASPTGENSR